MINNNEYIIVVANKIKKIDVNKKEITFKLEYPDYLKEDQEVSEEFLNYMSSQLHDKSDVRIRGLVLKWVYVEDKNN